MGPSWQLKSSGPGRSSEKYSMVGAEAVSLRSPDATGILGMRIPGLVTTRLKFGERRTRRPWQEKGLGG